MQSKQSQSLLAKLTKRSDIALAVLLVMIIFMMIISVLAMRVKFQIF